MLEDARVGVEALAYRPGRYLSPDSYSFTPRDRLRFEVVRLNLSRQEANHVQNVISSRLARRAPSFAFLKGNCVSYTRDLVYDLLGIRLQTAMSLLLYVVHGLLPDVPRRVVASAIQRYDDLVSSLPMNGKLKMWMLRLLFFVPPFYFLHVILGLLIKRLEALHRIPGQPTDLTWWDPIVAPWRVSIDHTSVMLWNLQRLAKKDQRYRVPAD